MEEVIKRPGSFRGESELQTATWTVAATETGSVHCSRREVGTKRAGETEDARQQQGGKGEV